MVEVMTKRKFTVLDHELVPEHIVLPPKDANRLLKTLGLNKSQLPWILASDPAAVAIGAKPGDVILILRKSRTAGKSIALRLVVPG